MTDAFVRHLGRHYILIDAIVSNLRAKNVFGHGFPFTIDGSFGVAHARIIGRLYYSRTSPSIDEPLDRDVAGTRVFAAPGITGSRAACIPRVALL